MPTPSTTSVTEKPFADIVAALFNAPVSPHPRPSSVRCVELDHVPVGIEDEDLGKSRVRPSIPLEPERVVGWEIVAIAGGAQVRECRVEVIDPDGKMHVTRVNRPIDPQRPTSSLYQVELAVAQRKPCAAKVERRRPFDLRQPHDLAVESSRTLQVRDRERDVVEGADAKRHGDTDDGEGAADRADRTQCITISARPPSRSREYPAPSSRG